MMPPRFYVDTSVFGGVADSEFEKASRRFFDLIRIGAFDLVVSPSVIDELGPAPNAVREKWVEVAPWAEICEVTPEALELQQAYLDAGVLTPKWEEDALHVALATVSRCHAIVSWNFRHIVNFRKIPRYNEVNKEKGYPTIAIYSPLEIVPNED